MQVTFWRRFRYALFLYRFGLWLVLWLFLTSFWNEYFRAWSSMQYGGVIWFGIIIYLILKGTNKYREMQIVYKPMLLIACYVLYALLVFKVWQEVFIVSGLVPLVILVLVGVLASMSKKVRQLASESGMTPETHVCPKCGHRS